MVARKGDKQVQDFGAALPGEHPHIGLPARLGEAAAGSSITNNLGWVIGAVSGAVAYTTLMNRAGRS